MDAPSVTNTSFRKGLRPLVLATRGRPSPHPRMHNPCQVGKPSPLGFLSAATRLQNASRNGPRPISASSEPSIQGVQPPAALYGITRRQGLMAGVALLASSALGPLPAANATALRSLRSDTPCSVTFINTCVNYVKCYWINYDGDPEFFAAVPPGGNWSVGTYESHPWRVLDADTNQLMAEYVAQPGDQVVRVDPHTPHTNVSTGQPAAGGEEGGAFEGFDGIGGRVDDYAEARLVDVLVQGNGGVAALEVRGYQAPVAIYMGVIEATSILYSAGVEFRRPFTTGTWGKSLQATGARVDRVLLTRVVGDTFYSRIVLRLPGGDWRSIDSRPSDSLALAMATESPVFVARQLASNAQQYAAIEQPPPEEDGSGVRSATRRRDGPGMPPPMSGFANPGQPGTRSV